MYSSDIHVFGDPCVSNLEVKVFMKRVMFALASALLVSGSAIPAAVAGMSQDSAQTVAVPSVDEVTPFDLTYFTYSGGLEDYGIRGGTFLVSDFRAGDISAQEIVETAVAQDLVSSNALTDPMYIDQVDDFLNSLTRFDP